MCIDDIEKESLSVGLTRKGDDILCAGAYKLSVSIATLSRFSGLIHVGINIEVGKGCPVKAMGLNDIIRPVMRDEYSSTFGKRVAKIFAKEYEDVKKATYKVKEV
jgi:hypothetical protein